VKEQKAKVQRFTKNIAIVALAGLTAIIFAGCKGNASAPGAGEVAATVNGQSIMLKEVDGMIARQYQGQQSKMSTIQQAQVRLQVLEQLIQKEVLFQRAKAENLLPKEEDITASINAEKQKANMTEEQYQKMLADTGQTEMSMREDARKLLAIKALQDKVTGTITIKDSEVDEAYNTNQDQFINKRGVELAAIIVDPGENQGFNDDAKGELDAKSKIDAIYQQLKSADFAEVARARSEDQSGLYGGDLGFAAEADLRQRGFPDPLVSQFFTMEAGSYTAPVQLTSKSWAIFKVKRKQLQDENLNLDSPGVRQKIQEVLINQRKELIAQTLIEVAMNEARVINNLAGNIIANPNNLGQMRFAPQASPAAAPASTPAATSATTPAPAPTATTPAASPAKGNTAK
jgi:parvulin-like peptidyl-prolyl isomerase